MFFLTPTGDLSADEARAVVEAAVAHAGAAGIAQAVAVVDLGPYLKAFVRMDGAEASAGDLAIARAQTARHFTLSPEETERLSQPGQLLHGLSYLNGGPASFPGGIPLRDGSGAVVGAIGVARAVGDQSAHADDQRTAEAGAAAFRRP